MRATLGQAMVVVVMISVSGCTTSSPTWSSLAFWRKKPDTSAVAAAGGEAPKYNAAAAATLPSANQNPNNSLAGIAKPPAASTAAGANPANPGGAAGLSGYGATPAGYQSSAYPTTPYPQAKLASAAPAGTTGAWVTPGTPATAAAVAASPAYAAAPPAYGAAAPAVGQPQTGLYNPTYDGGAANRYVSGTAIPATQSSMPDYRTADARNAMSASVAPTTMAAAPPAAAPMNTAPPADDRYAGAANAMTSAAAMPVTAAPPATATAPASSGPFPASPDRYAVPAGDNRPAASSYDPSATGYQPTSTTNQVGNTGYNPPNVYSPSAAAGSTSMSGLPAQSNTEYRPGGTSNFVSPTGAPVQPTTGTSTAPDTRLPSSGVTPAAYLPAAVNGSPTPSGVVLASASTPISSGNEVYGAYQGTSTSGTSNEPAYSSPTPTATAPALLPAHAAW